MGYLPPARPPPPLLCSGIAISPRGQWRGTPPGPSGLGAVPLLRAQPDGPAPAPHMEPPDSCRSGGGGGGSGTTLLAAPRRSFRSFRSLPRCDILQEAQGCPLRNTLRGRRVPSRRGGGVGSATAIVAAVRSPWPPPPLAPAALALPLSPAHVRLGGSAREPPCPKGRGVTSLGCRWEGVLGEGGRLALP